MGVRIRKHPLTGEYYLYINHKKFRQAQRIARDRRLVKLTDSLAQELLKWKIEQKIKI